MINPPFGDDRIQWHIPSAGGEMRDALALVRDAQQTWAASVVALAQRCETAIIKTTTHAKALTVRIKSHQRQHDDIQLPHRAQRAIDRFGNAEAIGL